jgi:hypothetical protein
LTQSAEPKLFIWRLPRRLAMALPWPGAWHGKYKRRGRRFSEARATIDLVATIQVRLRSLLPALVRTVQGHVRAIESLSIISRHHTCQAKTPHLSMI